MHVARLKRGQTRADGMVFWAYKKGRRRADGTQHEWEIWRTPERILWLHNLSMARSLKWRKLNPDKVRAIKRANYHAHKETVMACQKRWRAKNTLYLAEINKEYRNKHRAKLTKQRRVRINARYRSDPLFRTKALCSRRLRAVMTQRGFVKGSRTKQMIGCEWPELMRHIEAQFQEGMSWLNQHLWHIDHKIPLASATTEEELIRLFHFSNLQPLWAKDNIRKSCKV